MAVPTYIVRNPRAITITASDAILFIAENGEVIEQATSNSQGWSEILQRLSTPMTTDDLIASAEPDDWSNALSQRLNTSGCLMFDDNAEHLMSRRDEVFTQNQGFDFRSREQLMDRLIFAMSGSIVAGLLAPTVLSLMYSGIQKNLEIILTEAAESFVNADLFEYYGIRTWRNAFERRDGFNVPHVQLGGSADCILVLPATASTLQRLASAACTDLLSLTVTASQCPLVLAPVMNQTMWCNSAVQRHVEQLRQDGAYIIEPTIIFGAADLGVGAKPMYGGHGTLWAGPGGLMDAIKAIMHHWTGRQAGDRKST